MTKKEKWIQKVVKGSKGKWSLHAMLNIPEGTTIPKTLLKKIIDTEIGKTAHNPTNIGSARVKVTRKLKQKALFAYNVRK